ncbi:MAG: hypothetical protein ACJAY9_000771 [Flavobacteriales bacterium]|jgi:hypothetical protein
MAGKNSVFEDNQPPSADSAYLNLYRKETNNIITGTGQTLNDAIDNQAAISIAQQSANNFYIDSGSANAYVLTLSSSFTSPVSATVGYFTGMEIKFRAGNAGTGIAAVVNVGNAGNKSLKESDGTTNPTFISTTEDSVFRFDGNLFRRVTNYPSTFSNKNAIINGDMDISQRGTSFTSVANATYSLDRWYYGKSGTMVHDISQSSDVPTVAQAGRKIINSVLIDCTTAQGSIGAADSAGFEQKIEGYNFKSIAEKVFTLSFWVKATKTGIYCANFRNGGNDRSFVSEYTINTTDTWEFKTITVDASPSVGTWDYENGIGLFVSFILARGSDETTTAGTWQTGTFTATTNQVNACDSASNNFRLAGVQVEAGSIATPFQIRSIGDEIELCQRYFQKTYNIDTPPGTVTNSRGMFLSRVEFVNDITLLGDTKFIQRMRDDPSIITYSVQTGAAGKLEDDTAGVDINPTISTLSETGYRITGSGMTIGNTILWHHTADAEL